MPRVSPRKAIAAILGRQRREGGAEVSDLYTTFTGSPFDVDTGGPTWTGTLTVKDAANAAIPNVQAVTAVALQRVSATKCFVLSDVTVMDADGVDVCTITVQVMQEDQEGGDDYVPLVGVPAANVVLSVSGSNNNITQPAAATDVDGVTTGSFTTTTAEVKTITATILGIAADQQPEVDAGGSITPPAPGDPFFEDDFAGPGYNNANGWVWSTGTNVTPVSFGGSDCLRFRFGPDADGEDSNAEQRFNMGQQLTEVWFQYDVFYPTGYVLRNSTGPDNNKFFRLWGNNYNADNKVGGSTVYTAATVEGSYRFERRITAGGSMETNGAPKPDLDVNLNAWNQVRLYCRMPTGTGTDDGQMTVWINGVVLGDADNIEQLYDTTYPYWDQGYLFGWANSGYTDETDLHVRLFKAYESDPGW